MGRWQPGARGRLGQAALELYVERGYDQTTVAEIAERAGVTSRTFFRHFVDKREVLFAGTDAVGVRLVEALDAVPASAPPMEAVALALDGVATLIGDDHEHSQRRHQIIVANTELHERELAKLAAWSRALADGLRRRGADEPAASLAAEVGVAVFRVAFDLWADGRGDRPFTDVLRESFALLPTVH